MKIAHVLPSLARGGGERLTIELANRQVQAGHAVSLIVGSLLPKELIHDGLDPRVSTHFVTSDRGRARYRAMLPWLWRRRVWLRSQDIIHCHLTYGALFGAAFRGLGAGKRPAIVETYHAVGMPIPAWLKRLHSRLAKSWDGLALMVEDPFWRKVASSRQTIEFRIIPVGVEPPAQLSASDRDACRASLGISGNAQVVTTIGRLVPERLPRAYIPVFANISRALSDLQFVMGGDGPERQVVEADALAAGIMDRLHLLGTVTNIASPLAISNLYITANVGPVPGVAGLQAIAAGVPVIAIQLRNGYVSGERDWIWSSSDPNELAHKALELLQNPQAAKDLADRQRAHLEKHHSASAMALAYEDFYRAAIVRAGSD